MEALIWLGSGVVTGWLAGKLMKGRDYGLSGNLILGLLGSLVGGWLFIGLFLLGMLVWMIVNTEIRRPFDPFPFILLNLVLSCLAALQAPVIMMSQNRQALKDRLMASNDYEVNLRSEMEIQGLHARFDQLRERDW